MIELVIASAIHLAMLQSSAADDARSALRACIKDAAAQAKAQKVGADGFPAFVRERCAEYELSFKKAVWAFDSKNKVPKKQSEEDAVFQIEDFVAVAADRYSAETTPQ